jgi:fructose-1,6-bisphosphatase II
MAAAVVAAVVAIGIHLTLPRHREFGVLGRAIRHGRIQVGDPYACFPSAGQHQLGIQWLHESQTHHGRNVIAGAQVPEGAPNVMRNLPSYYSYKIAYGPEVAAALQRDGTPYLLDTPLPEVLRLAAKALGKHVRDLVVMTLDRPRHADIVRTVRQTGAGLRMIGDGDITAAVAPSIPGSGIDLYVGAGGSPEAILAAAALKCLGGDMEVRMWFHDEAHRAEVAVQVAPEDLRRTYRINDLLMGESALFCATGITDNALVKGINIVGHRAGTHSILMRARSRTIRRIHAAHNLDHKTIRLRSRA